MTERKSLEERLETGSQKDLYNDWIIQDRFLTMNYRFFMNEAARVYNKGNCRYAREFCESVMKVDDDTRIKDVIKYALDLQYEEEEELREAGYRILYGILIGPFLR